ncbi:hypothetical protein D3C84_977320 [compost metagenome]
MAALSSRSINASSRVVGSALSSPARSCSRLLTNTRNQPANMAGPRTNGSSRELNSSHAPSITMAQRLSLLDTDPWSARSTSACAVLINK